MDYFVIEGGSPISGTLKTSGNKNEALPVLAATLLTDDVVTLRNIPRIRDVDVMLEVLEYLGADINADGNTIRIQNKHLKGVSLPEHICRRIRASILFAGPILARHNRVDLPPPGGDVIGRRRTDTHFLGLKALGALLEVNRTYQLATSGLIGADIFLDEASVTGTENLMMAASLAKGTTVIRNAACEPHVQGLARMLNKMGAKISGIGTNTLQIEGVTELAGCDHTVGPDYLEIGSYIGLAACTNGELTIEPVVSDDLRMIRMTYEKLGVRFTIDGDRLHVPAGQELAIQMDLHGAIPKVDDAPWPQFPTDLMSIAITVATQCRGTVLFFEKMFEGRMFFIDSLIEMGARIILCDPHRVVVVGPSKLFGTTLESPDVRAGMSLLMASLFAQGKSTINNVRQIDRGYERVDLKLAELGAKIERRR